MKQLFLMVVFTLLAPLGCLAGDPKAPDQNRHKNTVEDRVSKIIQSLSSVEWTIPSYMSYGEICENFVNDLTNNPDLITVVPPTYETDDWNNIEFQKYVGNCDKNEFTVNEEYKSVKTGGGDSSRISSGTFFYAKDEYSVWSDSHSKSIILYTGPKYQVPERRIGYVSDEDRIELRKEFVYSGTFYEIETNSCNKVESVNESASPLVNNDDPKRKSGIIDYKGMRYLFLIANIGSENTQLIKLFDLQNMSIGKSVCSAQHINKG